MSRRLRPLWLAGWLALGASAGAAETWHVATPPAALRPVAVNADWRACAALEVDVQWLGALPADPVLASVYLETKQDWWFESRQPLRLDGTPQRFRLRLDDLSPDWQAPNLRRTFGGDVRRWVRTWGLKVYSRAAVSGDLRVGDLRLTAAAPRAAQVAEVRLPAAPVAGEVNVVRFRLVDFAGDPFDRRALRGTVAWEENGQPRAVPVFFRQDFSGGARPGGGAPRLEPLERPWWCANWRPAVAGTYGLRVELTLGDRRLVEELGTVRVGAARAAPPPPPAPAADGPPRFVEPFAAAEVYRFTGDDWRAVTTAEAFASYWRAQLDWTPAWGHYTGLGEFDQELAWQLDEELRRQPAGPARPLLLFSEDELDNQGVYNWSDNPLNAAGGGPLRRPPDLFADARQRAWFIARARYLWARYGTRPQVTGLLIRLNRPHDSVTGWLQAAARELAAECPDLVLLADNPGLPKRASEVPLDLARHWTTDERLAPFSFISPTSDGEGVQLEGRYPGTTALVARNQVHHWAGASVFAVDVHVSEAAGDEVKVLCFLRTDPARLYQSPLLRLRGDDWNRVFFRLDDPAAWTCLDEPAHPLAPWELLNLREVGLRFFGDAPNEVLLEVRRTRLLGPPASAAARAGALAIGNLRGAVDRVTQYARFELAFDLNRAFRNPYDESEIDVSLTLTDPAGRTRRQPGFYHEPWELQLADDTERVARGPGAPDWRVRFTPALPGVYRWTLTAAAGGETAQHAGEFTCAAAAGRGFVRLSPRDPRQFEFSDGSPFFPIGHNLRSPSDRRPGIYQEAALANADAADRQGTHAFARWFRRMQESGENYTRLWMCPWWLGLEWNATAPGYHGLGYYHQANAARLDRLLDLAAAHDIYINLETFNHGALSTLIDEDWRNNPLSLTQPGGFLRYATDFFTNPEAQRLHRQKLRYTVARWGYSPNVAIWGIVTESEWLEPYTRGLRWVNEESVPRTDYIPRPYADPNQAEAVRGWLVETGRHLQQLDAHNHLVTAHFSNPFNGLELWSREPIQVVHNNAYTMFTEIWEQRRFQQGNGVADVMREYGAYFNRYRNRPLLIGEWGGHPQHNRESHLEAELHTGLWANFMIDAAGVTGYWWWNLLDARDLYRHFRALANFAAGEDRRGKTYSAGRAVLQFTTEDAGLAARRAGLVLATPDELFAYLYHPLLNRHEASLPVQRADDPRFVESGPGTLEAPARLQSGRYRVEYWDTFAGQVTDTAEIELTEAQRTIPVPSHRVDLALKLKPLPAGAPATGPAQHDEPAADTPASAREADPRATPARGRDADPPATPAP